MPTFFNVVLRAAAIPEYNREIIALIVDAVGREWRELRENLPPRSETRVSDGLDKRLRARGAIRSLVLTLRRIDLAAAAGDYHEAARAHAGYGSRSPPWAVI